MTQGKKAAPKKALKPDVAGFIPAIAREINVRLQKAEEIAGKADDHRLAAALKLEEARKKCAEAKINFKAWVEANVQQSYETVRKLARVGASEDPPKALADLRAGVRKAMKKSRAKKRAAAADPVSVAESALGHMKEAEASKFIERQAKKLKLALPKPEAVAAPKPAGSTLDDAKTAFLALVSADKLALLAFAAEHMGAEATIFGKPIKEAVANEAKAPSSAPAGRRRRAG